MKNPIDPTVDCVFKALLGREKNKKVLIDFINAVLKLKEKSKIQNVTILNPYNESEFLEGKLTVVDVKAEDELGNHYQIEIQLALSPALENRMLYTWSSIFNSLLQEGEKFEELKKVFSIWVLGKNLFPKVDQFHLPFSIYNLENNLLLTDQLHIHILQLPKWKWKGKIQEELDRWMYLFTQWETIDIEQPHEIFQTEEMKLVMDTLKQFSENQEDYQLYVNRRIAQMEANTIKSKLEQLETELQQTHSDLEQERLEKEQLSIEKEQLSIEKDRLLSLLQKAGIDTQQH